MAIGVSSTIADYITFHTTEAPIRPFFGLIVISSIICSLFIINKKLEKTLEERTKEVELSEEKYRTLVNNIIDVIVQISKNLKIIYISPQVKDFFGYNQEEMLNQNISKYIHQEDIQKVESEFKNAFNNGKNMIIDCKMLKSSKKIIQVLISGSLVKIDKEEKIIAVIRDITDQKKAEIMIKEQFKKLKELDQIRSDLVRRTSHELKTPLNSIYSSSQYLLKDYKDEMNEEILNVVRVINRDGKRLNDLVRNLLDAYYLESNGINLKKERCDIVKILRNCANDLVFSLKERDLFLKIDLTGEFYIELDKTRIEQIILNLLSNAIKNTPPKGLIYITLKPDSKYVNIIIRDTGIGLTKEEKENLFKKFGKIERQIEGKYLDTEGSGLGLYISKELVELHGGKILVQSEGRNKGSIFTVRLSIV